MLSSLATPKLRRARYQTITITHGGAKRGLFLIIVGFILPLALRVFHGQSGRSLAINVSWEGKTRYSVAMISVDRLNSRSEAETQSRREETCCKHFDGESLEETRECLLYDELRNILYE